jgi:hypothetical protein
MRTRTLLVALLLLSLLCVGFAYRTQQNRTQWEYTQTCKFNEMNKLGVEGWELVTATGGEGVTCFYLKRVK